MKKLVCELCGSTDLIKKDGVYVCESCGGKFSVEEARKMMVEGTVNVQGTVQIDDSNRLENYFVQAETEYEAGNSEKAAAYCDKILENNVRYAKAWFLKGKIEADENYFKKAIEYAAETSEANKLEMEQKIGAWLTDYIIQIFKRTDDLEKIALRILCLESFEDTVSRSYVDMHKIKQAVQSYLMHSFDLDFDPKLSLLGREPQIKLGLLAKEDVEEVLDRLKVGLYKELDDKTKTVLQTPQHLNLFCRVYAKNEKKDYYSIKQMKIQIKQIKMDIL